MVEYTDFTNQEKASTKDLYAYQNYIQEKNDPQVFPHTFDDSYIYRPTLDTQHTLNMEKSISYQTVSREKNEILLMFTSDPLNFTRNESGESAHENLTPNNLEKEEENNKQNVFIFEHEAAFYRQSQEIEDMQNPIDEENDVIFEERTEFYEQKKPIIEIQDVIPTNNNCGKLCVGFIEKLLSDNFNFSVSITTKNKKNKNNEEKKYQGKNFPKIFGQKIIKIILKSEINGEIWSLLKIEFEKLKDKMPEISQKLSFQYFALDSFKRWAGRLQNKYTSLPAFRRYWSKSIETLDFKEILFRKCLKKITKKFLREDAYRWIIDNQFRNQGQKKFKKSKINEYLRMIPKFEKGIHDPENFRSISD